MNRFTEKLDNLEYGIQGASFSAIEEILFCNNINDKWWIDHRNKSLHIMSDTVYDDILPLFASLLANMSEDDMNEYLAQYQ